jgi:5-methylcytosine-specific restriction endonuclease McrA
MIKENHVKLVCERCGGEYTRHESQEEQSRYCSMHCRYARGSRVDSSERSSHTDPKYYKNRDRALRRDDNKCTKCGATEDLHVHHIIPITHGGGHEMDNLKTLCGPCHKSAHASGDIYVDESEMNASDESTS